MNESSRKTLVIVVAAAALILAVWSGMRFLSGPKASDIDRTQTVVGPINAMSSMFGPDASGRPRTTPPPGVNIQPPPAAR